MKITIELDTSNEDDRHTADTYQMSAETRSACREAMARIMDRLKYCYDLDARSREELEAVRAVLLEELDGWEP